MALCPYAGHMLVFGESRNFCVALVTLDPDAISGWAGGLTSSIQATTPGAVYPGLAIDTAGTRPSRPRWFVGRPAFVRSGGRLVGSRLAKILDDGDEAEAEDWKQRERANQFADRAEDGIRREEAGHDHEADDSAEAAHGRGNRPPAGERYIDERRFVAPRHHASLEVASEPNKRRVLFVVSARRVPSPPRVRRHPAAIHRINAAVTSSPPSRSQPSRRGLRGKRRRRSSGRSNGTMPSRNLYTSARSV